MSQGQDQDMSGEVEDAESRARAVLETPKKKIRLLERPTPATPATPEDGKAVEAIEAELLRAQQEVPILGGLLAELLWRGGEEEKYGMRDLHCLLCTGKTAELKLLVGIKELRMQPNRDASQVRSYAMMCDEVQASHHAGWTFSRKLRFCTTEAADRHAAETILRLHSF
ncbi:PP2A4 [Symbiodinium sp. CCMP2592]|nr:PP2A4 [Symbiodinium sp. CCMP2592]